MPTYSRKVHLSDTDAAGVVYFASLLSICHEAYEASLETAGIDLKTFVGNQESTIPIVHAQIDFFRPLFCGDRLTIQLTATSLKETEFEISYHVLGDGTPSTKVAQAKTRHVCINPKTRARTSLNDPIMQWLQLLSVN